MLQVKTQLQAARLKLKDLRSRSSQVSTPASLTPQVLESPKLHPEHDDEGLDLCVICMERSPEIPFNPVVTRLPAARVQPK